MRMLTEAEMDQIFGGGDSSHGVTTLNPVQVTASRITSSGGFYVSGMESFGFPIDECSVCGGPNSTYFYYYALPQSEIPTPAGLRCLHEATAHPSYKLVSGGEIHIMNEYVYKAPQEVYSHRTDTIASPPTGYSPTAGIHYNGHAWIYAHGMVEVTNRDRYIYPGSDTVQTNSMPLTARENAILTVAHEAAHSRGVPDTVEGDQRATGAGVWAVNRFRAGAGANCPR